MPITYRHATHADNFATFGVFLKSITDYSQRTGVMAITGGNDPEKIQKLWERRRALWEHLSETSDQYWLAENESGEVIGYARSILRGAHRELTEFFVSPENQSAGVGRELLARAFPNDTPHRTVIATSDLRALTRYLKAGVRPIMNELYFERIPEPVPYETDLDFEIATDKTAALHTTSEIDSAILGYHRPIDHTYLMRDRTLYFYKRSESIVGYGYIEKDYYGPFAVLDNNDFPAILAHAETQAYALGASAVGFEIPTINIRALDYVLSRGYRIEGFLGSILADQSFGKLENYILSSPPFFL